MRLSHPRGRTVQLSYASAARPARELSDVLAHLDADAAVVRAALEVDMLSVSPWLPPPLAAALAVDSRGRARLRAELAARGLEVVTLSGVRYGDTAAADQPDWSTAERLEYTLDLARILVDLLPDDAVRGSVSTLGVGPRADWSPARERDATRMLGRLSGGLAEIAWQTGHAVRVGLQPTPGAVMDSVEHSVAALARVDKDRVGVCLDLADLACSWQDPDAVLTRFASAGIGVIKVCIAAAIEVTDPAVAAAALHEYIEPDRRHAVTNPAGGYAADIPDALSDALPGPWRIRYPVPLHAPPAAPLVATTPVWRAALRQLMSPAAPACEHFAVYPTRPPGPAGRRADPTRVLEQVGADLALARGELAALGLVPPRSCATR